MLRSPAVPYPGKPSRKSPFVCIIQADFHPAREVAKNMSDIIQIMSDIF